MSKTNFFSNSYPGEKGRRNDIALRRPWDFAVFVAGLRSLCAVFNRDELRLDEKSEKLSELSPAPPSFASPKPGCRFVLLIIFGTLIISAAAIYFASGRVPNNWIPWNIPNLNEEPTWFAHLQINRLKADGASCFSALSKTPQIEFTRLPDHKIDNACGFTDVVRLDQIPIPFNYRSPTTCGLSAALYWWERELDTISRGQLGSRLVRIDQLGTFSCRNIDSETVGSRSQHATANAIDIEAFILADGRRISVAKNWNRPTSEGLFLNSARKAACGVFNGVLGPDYNRLHATHFHLDLGPYLICR